MFLSFSSLLLIIINVRIVLLLFRVLSLPLTAGAWQRFSVLRLRQKNGAKRLLWSVIN
jgi:hypothetical protein